MLPQLAGAAANPEATAFIASVSLPVWPFHSADARIRMADAMPDETSMMPIISSPGPDGTLGAPINSIGEPVPNIYSDAAVGLPFRHANEGESARVGTGTRFLPNNEKGMTVAPGTKPREPSLPFKKGAVGAQALDLTLFPIERYAQVTAALASGEPRPDVLRRFVLTDEMWTSLTHAWAQRFDAEPYLAARYRELIVAAQRVKR